MFPMKRSTPHHRLWRARALRPLALLLGLWLVVPAAPARAQTPVPVGEATTVSPHGELKLDCKECHRENGWTPVRIRPTFNHAKFGFPLVAAHGSANCMQCHENLWFKDAPTACASCHTDAHRGELGANCATCHTERSFLDRGRMIQQHQSSRFVLEGTHRAADCESCHPRAAQGQMQFLGRPIQCDGCHAAQYASAKNPDHVAAGFPRDCQQCHASTEWNAARFNHDASGFPLTGAHRAVACDQCHTNNQFTGAPVACVACHLADYNGTTAPAHATAGYSTDCAACHGTRSWNANFDHSKTAFPLTGAHKALVCEQCHINGVFAGTPTACVSCHQTDYDNTTNPDHRASGFPTDCTGCHTTTVWTGAVFNHSATQFPLTGQHKVTPCDQCHGDGVYKGKPTACSACHLTDYTATTSPNHQQLGWPQSCTTCHSGSSNTVAWDQGVRLPSQYHTMFSVNHQGAGGRCTECHNTTNYAQSTCSNHHHPPSCTFTSQRACGD